MKTQTLNTKKMPQIAIDPTLEQYKGQVLFPKKLEKANAVLKKIGLPKLP